MLSLSLLLPLFASDFHEMLRSDPLHVAVHSYFSYPKREIPGINTQNLLCENNSTSPKASAKAWINTQKFHWYIYLLHKIPSKSCLLLHTSWWLSGFSPTLLKKMQTVKMGIFPNFRGANSQKIFELPPPKSPTNPLNNQVIYHKNPLKM